MHYDHVGRGAFEVPRMQAIVHGVFAHRGKERRVLSLALNSEDHHHVRSVNGIFKMFLDAQSALDEIAEFVWHERAWTTYADIRAELCQQIDIGTRDARVQDVANDRDLQSFDSSFVFTNRERVEQGLSRMLVRAVAGVDDRRGAHAREMLRRTGHRVTNDDAIRRHRFEVARSVEQSLAFGDAGGRNADVHGIRREAFGGNFEGSPRSGRWFEEEIYNSAPAECRDFFDLAFGNVAKRFGRIEQVRDFCRLELAYAEEVFAIKRSGGGCARHVVIKKAARGRFV